MIDELKRGENCCIGENVQIGSNVVLGNNCVIENDVSIGNNVVIESNTIIRQNTHIADQCIIGANCIIGEHLMDFYRDCGIHKHPLFIGEGALIRSGSIVYGESRIGAWFQTGHHVTIRENSNIGDHVSVGTLSDIQGNCEIGSYVRLHSNVHIGQLSKIDDFVWIFPYVVLTNDPTPPSMNFVGVHVCSFAIIATGAIVMPGIEIGQDSLVGAGAIVTKPVEKYDVVAGNPAKVVSDIRKVKNKITGEQVYPWRNHFKRAMPWEEADFLTWYNALDLNEKEKYNFDILAE